MSITLNSALPKLSIDLRSADGLRKIEMLSVPNADNTLSLPKIFMGPKGDIGLSAYQIAVEHGFTGSIEEWLLSLQGPDAYRLALNNGFVGTYKEWVSSWALPELNQSTQSQVLTNDGVQTFWCSVMDTKFGVKDYVDLYFAMVNSKLEDYATKTEVTSLTKPVTVTGDATGTSNYNESGNTLLPITLANTGVTAGVYGSNTLIPAITVNSKGLITSIQNTEPQFNQVVLGTTKTFDTVTTVPVQSSAIVATYPNTTKAVKAVISVEHTNDIQLSEVLFIINNNVPSFTEYGVVRSGGVLAIFSVEVNASNINLVALTGVAGLTIKVHSTIFN